MYIIVKSWYILVKINLHFVTIYAFLVWGKIYQKICHLWRKYKYHMWVRQTDGWGACVPG